MGRTTAQSAQHTTPIAKRSFGTHSIGRFGDVFGIYYGLTADDGFSYEEMRDWAERIKTQVVTADGVMKVALFGTQTEVVNIFVSVNKLAGMGIDPKQLASLLQSQNQIINTGEISAGEQQLRIVANGMYTTVDDIRNQVITTRAGQVNWVTSPS